MLYLTYADQDRAGPATGRLAAIFILSGYGKLTGYDGNLAEQMQFIMFFKNMAMAGGFLLLTISPLGRWTLDRKVAA